MSESTEAPKNHQDHLSNLQQTKVFLGREFLTWLWFQAETRRDQIQLPAIDLAGPLTATFWIDDRILLQPLDHTGHEHLMRGGTPSHSAEAATALFSGKMVKELKLGLHIDSIGEYTANLSYHDLSPRSLQLPPPMEDGLEAASVLAMRVQQTQSFLRVLDSLFALFMHERTSPEWETKGLVEIRDWMKERLQKSQPTLH